MKNILTITAMALAMALPTIGHTYGDDEWTNENLFWREVADRDTGTEPCIDELNRHLMVGFSAGLTGPLGFLAQVSGLEDTGREYKECKRKYANWYYYSK